MKKMLSMVLVLMMAIGLMIPAFSSAEEKKLVVVSDMKLAETATLWVNCENGKTLNVREQPTTKSKVLYRVECGTKLNVISGADQEWANVYADDKAVGYVMTKFLVKNKPGKYEITEREDDFQAVEPYMVTALPRGKNTEESVGLRVKPNKTTKAIRRLMAGDTLEVLEVGKTWSKVKDIATGETGYVANDYIARV